MRQSTIDAIALYATGAPMQRRLKSVGGEWVNMPVGKADNLGGAEVNFSDHFEYRARPITFKIGKIDVPEPERDAPAEGAEYFIPAMPFGYPATIKLEWDSDSSSDSRRLEAGLIHLTEEAAELHAKALISLSEAVR